MGTMPLCHLCSNAFQGVGNVCAPLGSAGSRCCDDCHASRVLPARAALVPAPVATDDHDLEEQRSSKRPRNVGPAEDPVVDGGVDDACDPGMDLKRSFVLPSAKTIQCAVKPPLSNRRGDNLVVDAIICCDGTRSMNGDGATGLVTTLVNLPMLLKKSLDATFGDDAGAKAAARAQTNIHFCQFGSETSSFGRGLDGFVRCDDPALGDVSTKIANTIKFTDSATDVESAVEYASARAKERFEAFEHEDAAAGVNRQCCFVLLTDGDVNQGSKNVDEILANAAAEISDFKGKKLQVFAIGLGTKTSPSFLSALTSSGFWKHVPKPHDPSAAFDVTLGSILGATVLYDVDVVVTLERGGVVVEGLSTRFQKSFGLTTASAIRARIVDVPLPIALEVGDVLRVEVRLPGLTTSAKIDVVSVSSLAEPRVRAPTGVEGLFCEALEIENAVEHLKATVRKGTFDMNTGFGLVNTPHANSAVRSQITRYSQILERSLSPTIPSPPVMAPSLQQPSWLAPDSDCPTARYVVTSHESQSSLSRIY